jgi:hypothetical protein
MIVEKQWKFLNNMFLLNPLPKLSSTITLNRGIVFLYTSKIKKIILLKE